MLMYIKIKNKRIIQNKLKSIEEKSFHLFK